MIILFFIILLVFSVLIFTLGLHVGRSTAPVVREFGMPPSEPADIEQMARIMRVVSETDPMGYLRASWEPGGAYTLFCDLGTGRGATLGIAVVDLLPRVDKHLAEKQARLDKARGNGLNTGV